MPSYISSVLRTNNLKAAMSQSNSTCCQEQTRGALKSGWRQASASNEFRLEIRGMSCILQPVLYGPWLLYAEYSQTLCRLLSSKSSGRNPTRCYRRLCINLNNCIIRKFILMCNLNSYFISSSCTSFLYPEPPSTLSLANTFHLLKILLLLRVS